VTGNVRAGRGLCRGFGGSRRGERVVCREREYCQYGEGERRLKGERGGWWA